ncbi:MAG: pyrroline-5-carboxylate reductase [Pirellulales bacterium]
MSTRRLDQRIGFVGSGRMATALAHGFLSAGLVTAESVIASDVLEAARKAFQKQTGSKTTLDNLEVLASSDLVFLAVKPQAIPGVVSQLEPALTPYHLVVSIAAGVTLGQLADGLGAHRRIVRVMPNTPCLVGASASAYCLGGSAGEEDGRLVHELLSAVGVCFELPESLMDAVTGLSGSGPAFICVVIEALADGGVRMGLPRDVATALAAQSVFGSAKMVLETGQHPGSLKDMVASPGGTTIAGLHALERGRLRAALIDAVEAATLRSAELGQAKH